MVAPNRGIRDILGFVAGAVQERGVIVQVLDDDRELLVLLVHKSLYCVKHSPSLKPNQADPIILRIMAAFLPISSSCPSRTLLFPSIIFLLCFNLLFSSYISWSFVSRVFRSEMDNSEPSWSILLIRLSSRLSYRAFFVSLPLSWDTTENCRSYK